MSATAEKKETSSVENIDTDIHSDIGVTQTQTPEASTRDKRPLSSESKENCVPVFKKVCAQEIPKFNLDAMDNSDTTVGAQPPQHSRTNEDTEGTEQTMQLILKQLSAQSKQNEMQLAKLSKLDSIEQKLDSIEEDMKNMNVTILELQTSVKSAHVNLSETREEIRVMKTRISKIDKLESEVVSLRNCNKNLQQRLIEQEAYSRRENIVIDGLKEEEHEDCEAEVQALLSHKLGVDSCSFERCHRQGKRTVGARPRRIIARLTHFKDKLRIMKNVNRLEGCSIFINNDYPVEIERERAAMRPYLRLAKKKDDKAKLVQNKLLFKGKSYTIDTVTEMDIDKEYLGMKVSDKHVFFAGQHSVLSNWFPCVIHYGDAVFKSAEHLYQHQKCIDLKRKDLAKKVLAATSPYEAMRIGKEVAEDKEWVASTGSSIMKEVVAAKMEQCLEIRETLKKYPDKLFVEATRNNTWGSGVPLTAKDVDNQEAWKGNNLLGKILTTLARDMHD